MSKEAQGENGYRAVVPAVKKMCKNFGTIVIPSITITLKDAFLFIYLLLLPYKFSGG